MNHPKSTKKHGILKSMISLQSTSMKVKQLIHTGKITKSHRAKRAIQCPSLAFPKAVDGHKMLAARVTLKTKAVVPRRVR